MSDPRRSRLLGSWAPRPLGYVWSACLPVLVCVPTGDPPFPTAAPFGLPPILAPADNPMRKPVYELGARLFASSLLSIDRSISCASCHEPDHGFASRAALPQGAAGRRALRHAPTLYNRAWGKSQRWDGATPTLEAQVLLPIEDHNEMALPLDDAIARLRADVDWNRRFQKVFGKPPDATSLARALACFVRGLVHGDSAVDRFQAGDRDQLDARERRGLWLYESKAGCWQCHSGPNLTDESFHNTGVGAAGDTVPDGRFAVTGREEDRGKFKTPTLRALADTAPYMHDGSQRTLRDVVEFYRKGGNPNVNLDRRMRKLDLTDNDTDALVAFLRALSRPSRKGAGR